MSFTNYLDPPFFTPERARLEDRQVELLFNEEQKNLLEPYLKEEASFISLPKGKQIRFKDFHEDDGKWVVSVKGMSYNETQVERTITLGSYPWVYTASAIVAIPSSCENIVFSRKIPISRLNWHGLLDDTQTRLSYIGEDKNYSLWQVYFKGAQRLCLGSFYSFNTQWGDGQALVLSGILSEFKTKRESMGLFLQGASSLEAFLNFRLTLGLLSCPPAHQALLPDGKVKELSPNFFLKKSHYESLKGKTVRLTQAFGGVSESFLNEKLGEEKILVTLLLKYWRESGLLATSEGFYWQAEGAEDRLSPLAKAMLARIEERGQEGIALGSLRSTGEKETLKALGRLGLIAGYAPEEFFFSLEALKELEAKLRLIAPDLEAPLSQIRDWLGVSRKVAITLCESLQEQGILEREDEDWTWVADAN